MPVDAELKRRLPDNTLDVWRLNADGTDPVADAEARTKLQSIINALAGALTVSDAAAQTTMASLLAEFRNRYDVVSTSTATYSTSGNHTLVTPPAGQSLRVVWLYAQAAGALGTGLVTVTFTLGANAYTCELTGSQPFAHSAVWEGAANQSLVVNTSSTAAVIVNADWRAF